MRSLSIFLYEWKHFTRSPFKIVALLLFIVASIYGLHNGASLYKKQSSEIEKLVEKRQEEKDAIISYFEKGEKGPENRPWMDLTTPYWAIRNVPTYHFKKPSPDIVYSVGQAEQYGFYKKISIFSSPYDTDMAKEIANPERIQSGTLDFSFVILFLLPLLLLVLLYNIKALEAEQGFLPLTFVQTGSKNWWIVSRTAFYTILLFFTLLGLLLYGATLTDVFSANTAIWNIFLYLIIYLLFWSTLYYLIIKYGKSTINNTLLMIGVWLFLAFIIPATIQQWISIEKPTNLMVEFIDVKRDKKDEINGQPDELTDQQIFYLYPKLKQTIIAKDSVRIKKARQNSKQILINSAMKNAAMTLEEDNKSKNDFISKTKWLNPLTFFQNKLNNLTGTHYDDYQTYRNEIQNLVDKRLEIMVFDIWNDVQVDKTRYLNYSKDF